MKYAFSIILFTIFNFKSNAQLPANSGNGAIQINWYGYVGRDTVSLGIKDGRKFLEMHHFMLGSKVFCSDAHHSTSTEGQDENGISHSLSAEISVPHYIIDLKTSRSTFIAENNGQVYYCDTPILKNKFDLFYKKLLNDADSPDIEVDTVLTKKLVVAGKQCKEGRYRTKLGWRSFCYSKENLGFYSPLNAFVRGCKYPILRIDAELQDDPKDRRKITGIARFEIENIDLKPQKPDLFVVPEKSTKLTFSEFEKVFLNQH